MVVAHAARYIGGPRTGNSWPTLSDRVLPDLGCAVIEPLTTVDG